MRIVIEFYRTREKDDAHAVIGRETAEAADLDDAIDIARWLSQTLGMPQRPDAMTITDAIGTVFMPRISTPKCPMKKDDDHERHRQRCRADRSWTVYHVFTGPLVSAAMR